MNAMQRDYYYPDLANRDDPRTWEQQGKEDIWQAANQKARDVLAKHKPEYLNRDADQKIRQTLKILL